MEGLFEEALKQPRPVSVTFRAQLDAYVVTAEDIEERLAQVVYLSNLASGPYVVWDDHRHGYGLRADRRYKTHEIITRYGGEELKSVSANGPYMLYYASKKLTIDGHHGFKLCEKARWMNEFSGVKEERAKNTNAKLGMNVTALRVVKPDDWIFVEYGTDYTRTY